MRTLALPTCGDTMCAGVEVPYGPIKGIDLDPAKISIIMISETPPLDPEEAYYAPGNPLFGRTTLAAFNDAGIDVASVPEIVGRGVYLTTAVKCAKRGYALDPETIARCARLLELELRGFPNARVLLLMGDTAIRTVNEIARQAGEPRVVPSGATYRIRGGDFRFRGMHVLPSYLQAGPAFFIEKTKRRMIAEDIRRAFELVSAA